ncbi:MAG: OmpA family protein [Dechloromonas sp.]|uniref:OmpA family protein n=1 Tax=Candidatus Dechloromonas phosphorivorans TaxID=2899244 RepID=A0A935JYP1_9RHOO|nr:OmpA family protein [Candidatus Dechloromonas phosphorivorans]
MMRRGGIQLVSDLSLVALLLAGCAGQRETYAVLPDAKGQAGSLTVTPKEGAPVKLNGAYASAVGKPGSAPEAAKLSEEEIKAAFAEALSARPDAPLRFTLYFKEGSDELTPDSAKELERVLAEIRKRPAPDLIIVGHTDRVGLLADNDRLALKRAEKMRGEMVRQGLPADSVQAAGRGEREPLVPTADEVAEARNRRVEMLVR